MTNEDVLNGMLRKTFPKVIFIHSINEVNKTQAIHFSEEWLNEEYEPQERKNDTWSLEDVSDALKRHGLLQRQEPCDDAISRADTIEWLKKVTVTDGITFETGFKQILTDIRNMPPVTPNQKMGHWKRISTDKYVQHAMAFYRCSECGEDIIGEHNYCPNCGAKMEESE